MLAFSVKRMTEVFENKVKMFYAYQAGIYVGEEGFDITVKDNTNLEDGVIDSQASKDKNAITTGTLTWEDTENKAEYKASGMGVSYAPNDKNSALNQRGLTPSLTPTVKDSAESTTKSAIEDSTITITDKDHQKQDIANLNRDTKNSLNQLQEIFDRSKVEEQQELASKFAELGAKKIGDIANENHWSKDDPRRALLHGLLGGITAELGGNSVLSGAVAAGGMESLQPMVDNFLKDHPDMREEVAGLFGYAVGTLFGGDGDTGAFAAWNATHFNWLSHAQIDQYATEIRNAKTPEEREAVLEKWLHINDLQGEYWVKNEGPGTYIDLSGEKETIEIKPQSAVSSNVSDGINPFFEELKKEAVKESGETLASKGMAWTTANWYEASFDHLSRQEAETIGKNISSGTLRVLEVVTYLKAVSENHQRYNNWQNAIKADGFEMIPIVVGITATGILTNYNLVTKFGIAVSSGAISNYYVNQKKAELEKSEQNNLLNPGNNTKSKDGEE